LSKTITSVQESDKKTLAKNTAWITYSYQNIDKVSCYANAVLQCCIYTLSEKLLLNYDKLDVLNLFAHQYHFHAHMECII